MSALSIQQPYPIFTDIDGQPLEDGYVWIGTANLDPQTNPINVYWDAALTLPAAQPIRTLAGYPANSGTPARMYVNSDYSIRVMNKNGSAVYSAPAATERYSSAIISQIDSALVNYIPAGTGAVATTVQEVLRDTLSVFRFMTAAQIADVRSGAATLDVTAAVQAAIDAAIYNGNSSSTNGLKQVVYMPAGTYRITNTLHLGYGTSFTSVSLIGAGSKFRGESAFSGTAIVAAFSDRPAIAVQGGRRVAIKDLALVGANYAFVSSGDFGGTSSSVDDTSLSVWLSPSLNANANSRYAPYAGIAIDPYSGTEPTPAYPNVTFPSFIGSPGQYNKSFTDTVIVSNCYIAGFVVGAVIQPCNADGNGDFVSFRDTSFEYLPYGISAGNSQGREVNAINCGFRNVHTCVTNNKHGKQIGKLGGNHSGTHYDRVIQIYDLDTSYSGPIAFTGCYGELVWRLGSANTPVTRSTHLQVASSELRFTDHPATRGVPATLTANNHTIDFIGGSIQLGSIATGSINFDGTKVDCLDCTSVTPSTARKNAQQVSGGVLPIGTQLVNDVSKFLRHTLIASVTRSADRIATTTGRANAISRIARFARHADTVKAMPAFGCPSPLVSSRDKVNVVASFSGITGTLDFTSLYSALFPFKISAGDLIQDDQTGTVFLVESVTSAVATVTALNNYKNTGSGNVFRDAVSTTVGNWYVLNTRLYGTTYPLFGDITSGSAVIANIGRGDSYAAFASTDLAVGDYIWQDDWQGRLFPNGATISAIDTTARTITMSGVATKTQAGILLPFWVRA